VPEEEIRLGIPCRKWSDNDELEVKILSGRMCTGFKWLRTRVVGHLLGYYVVETVQELQTSPRHVLLL